MNPLDAIIKASEAKVRQLENELTIEQRVLSRLKKAHASMNGKPDSRQNIEKPAKHQQASIPDRLTEIFRKENRPMSLSGLTEILVSEGFNGPSVAAALSRSAKFTRVSPGMYSMEGGD